MQTCLVVVAALWMLVTAPAPAPVDVTGDWAVTITAADGAISGRASLEQKRDRVTGTIGPSTDATIAVEGVLAGTRLTLTTHPRPGRTAAFESCELTVAEAKMA